MDCLDGALVSWKYSPLPSSEHDLPVHRLATIKNAFSSRTCWRFILASTLALLVIDIFKAESTVSNLISSQPTIQGSLQTANSTDWSQFAYCQYVTNEQYLCNSLMMFESLHRLNSQASRVMMYPHEWDIENDDNVGTLLRKARDEYNVQLSPIEVQHFSGDPTWADSFTKLLAFNQTQFKRVLSLDSDATILASLDELFLLPSAPVAMPRAYWLDGELSSQLVLVEPSKFQFERIINAIKNRTANDFDMEIVNHLYGNECFIIPHRPYNLITGEFRSHEHHRYLGSKEEAWNPEVVMEEAKFIHFSDWPLPKPWLPHTKAEEEDLQPDCEAGSRVNGTHIDGHCSDRRIWTNLYQDFGTRREVSIIVVHSHA